MKRIMLTLIFFSGVAFGQQMMGDVQITAETLECKPKENICIATGNAKVVKGQGNEAKTLKAKIIKAFLSQDADKKLKVQRVEAEGQVHLISAQHEEVFSDQAEYDVATHKAFFNGHVEVKQGANRMTGPKGVADLKTGSYRMLSGVSGVVIPEAKQP